MEMLNATKDPKANVVSVLDRRTWQRRPDIGYNTQTPATLYNLIIQGLKTSPGIKKVVVASTPVPDFVHALRFKRPYVVVMYKVADIANPSATVPALLGERFPQDMRMLVMKERITKLSGPDDYVRSVILAYDSLEEAAKDGKRWPIYFTYPRSLDEMLSIADDMIRNENKYVQNTGSMITMPGRFV